MKQFRRFAAVAIVVLAMAGLTDCRARSTSSLCPKCVVEGIVQGSAGVKVTTTAPESADGVTTLQFSLTLTIAPNSSEKGVKESRKVTFEGKVTAGDPREGDGFSADGTLHGDFGTKSGEMLTGPAHIEGLTGSTKNQLFHLTGQDRSKVVKFAADLQPTDGDVSRLTGTAFMGPAA